ncbi:MAG: hypothetical protein ACLR4D_00870 [Faecalibacterium sp.]
MALYAAILFSFAVILCRLYFLAQNQTYAARAKAQSAVRLALPARRGNFYDHTGALLTGLETQYLALCFPGENSYSRLYAYTDENGQALLYQNRNRSMPFLLRVERDLYWQGVSCYPFARRYASAPLCQQLIGYLDGEGHGAAGLEKALDKLLTGTGNMTSCCALSPLRDSCETEKHRSISGRTARLWGAADHFASNAARSGSGSSGDYDQRVHFGSGYSFCRRAGQRQHAGL